MALTLVTAAAGEPLTLDDVKGHLKITSTDQDGEIVGWITAAREWAETRTGRALITQTWDLKLDGFPVDGGPITVPKPPLISVTSITYVDTNGVTQTWSSALYTVDAPTGPQARSGQIWPAYNESYPGTRAQVNAVTVRFVCGYGAVADLVPASIRSAMKILIATWNAPGRQSVNVGSGATVVEIPDTVDLLVSGFQDYVGATY